MILLTVSAAFLISVVFFRLMRKLFWILVVAAAALFVVGRLPIQNASLQSFKLLLGVFGHFTWTSLQQGFHQYQHWGQALLHRHLP
jgi:hypothetical protein